MQHATNDTQLAHNVKTFTFSPFFHSPGVTLSKLLRPGGCHWWVFKKSGPQRKNAKHVCEQ